MPGSMNASMYEISFVLCDLYTRHYTTIYAAHNFSFVILYKRKMKKTKNGSAHRVNKKKINNRKPKRTKYESRILNMRLLCCNV